MKTALHFSILIMLSMLLSGCFFSSTSSNRYKANDATGKTCFKLSDAFFMEPSYAQTGKETNGDPHYDCSKSIGFKYTPRISESLRHPDTNSTSSTPAVPARYDNCGRLIPGTGDVANVSKGVTTWIVEQVKSALESARTKLFSALNTDGSGVDFIDILRICMALVLIFYACALLMGLVQANPYAVAMMFLKIILVYALIRNADGLFDRYVIDIFENFVEGFSCTTGNVFYFTSLADVNGNCSSANFGMFNMVDETMSMLFSFEFITVMFALINAGWSGWLYAVMILGMIVTYSFTAVGAVKSYLIAMIARYLLYALAPIFIIFLLFNQTKSMFDGWIEQLISFSLQPVFLMTFIGMFHLIIMGFIPAMLNYNTDICYAKVHQLGATDLYGYVFGDGIKTPRVDKDAAEAAIPINIWVVMSMAILAYLMKSMADWSAQLAARLSSGYINITDAVMQGWNVLEKAVERGTYGMAGTAVGGTLFGTEVKRQDGTTQRVFGVEGMRAAVDKYNKETVQVLKEEAKK